MEKPVSTVSYERGVKPILSILIMEFMGKISLNLI